MDLTTTVRIPSAPPHHGRPATAPDYWAETVTVADVSLEDNPELKRGQAVTLEVGSLLLIGVFIEKNYYVALAVVYPDGTFRCVAASSGPDWEADLQDAIVWWVGKTPAQRVILACKDYLFENEIRPGLEMAIEIQKRQRWVLQMRAVDFQESHETRFPVDFA